MISIAVLLIGFTGDEGFFSLIKGNLPRLGVRTRPWVAVPGLKTLYEEPSKFGMQNIELRRDPRG